MSSLHTAVIEVFKKQGWAYRTIPDHQVLETQFEAYHSKVFIHLQSYDSTHILLVVGKVSLTVPHTHKSKAAELLMRVNRQLNLGAFEMDWDSGTIEFRQSQIFSPHRYDERIIANLVHNTIAEVDRYTAYIGVLNQTAVGMLLLLNIPDLLMREDLLPPAPTEVT